MCLHLFILRKARAGNVLQSVFLAAVDGEVVVAALAGVDKLQVDVFADALQIAVVPDLEWERRGLAAALFHGPLIHAAGGMRVNRVRRSPHNVDAPAIRLPARLASRKMLVGIGDAPVVLFAKLVFRGIGIGVAAQPEVLNKRFALLVVAQAHERLALFVGNDVGHFLVQPGLIGPLQLLPQSLLRLVPLLVAELAIERIGLLILILAGAGWACC